MTSEAVIQHSPAFRRRRFLNWFPLGLSYAFLYMGRYNLTVAKTELGSLMTKEDFGIIFGVGTITYAFAFLINGPLTDRIGGKRAILIALLGSSVMNMMMALFLMSALDDPNTATNLTLTFSILYAVNMYFQSFGAVSIVKINSHWFHVRERGGFSGIFGTMISSGIFFAFTINYWILDLFVKNTPTDQPMQWVVFMAPSIVMAVMLVVEFFLLKDRPGLAGHEDFDTGDASSGEDSDTPVPTKEIFRRIFTNPIIMTLALIEFCTGVLRNGIMHWFPIYAKEVWVLPSSHPLVSGGWESITMIVVLFVVATISFVLAARSTGKSKGYLYIFGGLAFLAPFLQGGWGGILFVAGVIGANAAGWVSDLFFQSRRAPAAGGLYAVLAVCMVGMVFTLGGTTTTVDWASSVSKDAWGETFEIEKTQEGYLVYSKGPDKKAGTDDDVKPPTDPKAKIEDKDRDLLKTRKSALKMTAHLTEVIKRSGASPADAAAAQTLLTDVGYLRSGDKVLSVVDDKEVSDWDDIASTISCIPATCKGESKWDTKVCQCKTNPAETSDVAPSDGIIPARVERDGKTMALFLADPKPKMQAGDKRKFKAGPVLTLSPWFLGVIVFIVSICVIGTHGLLSGTATMDFGGRKAAATAVGIIDGFVYLGTGLQSFALGYLTTQSWSYWPTFLLPFAIIGFLLCRRIWDAKPTGSGGH